MKREVTDVLMMQGGAPLAFNQIDHKNGEYECICPWCANDLGKVKAEKYGELVEKMWTITVEHMNTCPQREATEMNVNPKF